MVTSIALPRPFGMDCPTHDEVHGEVHEDVVAVVGHSVVVVC